MRHLLDTHALIWLLTAPDRLSAASQRAMRSPANIFFVSSVNILEIALKHRLGKNDSPPFTGAEALELALLAGCHTLDFAMSHAIALDALPLHHRDPFDRMLVSQAITERVVLVTRDADIRRYDVQILVC